VALIRVAGIFERPSGESLRELGIPNNVVDWVLS
jgi:hypothetical protein